MKNSILSIENTWYSHQCVILKFRMMIGLKLTGLLFIFSLLSAEIQECGTVVSQEDYIRDMIEYSEISDTRPLPDILWAPITFHVVRTTEGTGGLPPHRVEQGLIDLLTAYSDADILPYQLGEIDYIDDTDYLSVGSYDEIDELKQINVVPTSINIYCVNYLSNGENELCGISSFSWGGVQGIVMSNSCFATSDNHSTLPHEVGHYFNLYHTHQGSGAPNDDGVIAGSNTEFVDGTECDTRGDGLCGTPADPNVFELINNSCEYFGTWVDGHGDLFQPDTSNIMSYSAKWCRVNFSEDQNERSVYTIQTYRPELDLPPTEPFIVMLDSSITEYLGDNDGVINPNESAKINVTIQNWEYWPDAEDVSLTLVSENSDIIITDGEHNFNLLASGEIYSTDSDPFIIEINSGVGVFDLTLILTATTPEILIYTREFSLQIDVNLHQSGWPLIGINQVESSPLVMDINNDGDLEICFGDYDGLFHVVDNIGNELPGFPFDTGDDIWGAPAAADIDNDDEIELVITSKSGHIFILNTVGEVELDYDAGQFLMATPALGNLDDDPDMEIVVAGYSGSGKVFAINFDGMDVSGFPVELNEKVMRGAALSDIDGNGRDDIVIATESDHLWIIDDSGNFLSGFPFTSNDKFRTAPSIVDLDGNNIILVGCRDDLFYAVNDEGILLWYIDTGSDVSTSTGFVEWNGTLGIFFGNEEGSLFGVDQNGNNLPGFPIETGSSINVTPSFSDLDGDGIPEIITGNASGFIHSYHLNGEPVEFFPFNCDYEIIGSPTMNDLDGDDDLEIIIGTTAGITVTDVKTAGIIYDHWSMYRGNPLRNGYFNSSIIAECGDPQIGDLNCDESIDITDIVILVNIILDIIIPDGFQYFAGDSNDDGIIDILDVILLVSLILNN